jgi:RHS repeat-associated protein
VSLTSPTNNATFSTPADITLTASASSSDGKTPTVEFYHDGVLLSSTNVSPFTYTWKGVAAGKYSLTARAIDSLGAAATSTAVNVTVSDPASNPVQFTSPKSGTTYVSPAAITLSTSAPSNTVGVTYYRTDTGTNIQIGSSNTSPYSYTWNMRTPGTYTVISQAVVNVSGSLYTLTSDPITVTVTANPTGETITYLHNDFLGSAIAATDANGAVIWQEDYNPYGERLINNTDASGNRQFYTGKPLDTETGLTYFGARYYDPAVGRFMTIDPVGFKEDIYSFNRYGYGNNNPYKFVDPDGRDAQLLIGGPYAGHSYGHVALRVYGKGYDVTYDFGRYGATWGTFGSEGEGMLRVWSNFNSYIAGENATGRTTTAYTYKTTPEADKATMAFYENQIGKSSAIETRAGMKQFRIQDYHAANNNCTTESIAGLGAGNPGLASRLNNPKFDTGGSLGAMERLAYRTAKKGSGISMPSDLNDSIRSAGGYSNSTTYPK